MKDKLKIENDLIFNQVHWIEIVKHYWENISDDQASYILWNLTCFPFDTDEALNQLYELYLEYPNGMPSPQ